MTKELHYFNVHALAEPIKYILHYTKQKFDYVQHEYTSWPDHKVKESLPFGQLPIYKENGRTLHQSLAIAKYVARGTELIPMDPWEQAVLESIVYTIFDFYSALTAYISEKDMDKKHEMKKKLLEETIDYFFSRFEKYLKENGGFFTGKLSWVEFILVGVVEMTDVFLGIELEKKYPMIAAVVEKIRNLPGVKEYIKTRGPYQPALKSIPYKGMDILENRPF